MSDINQIVDSLKKDLDIAKAYATTLEQRVVAQRWLILAAAIFGFLIGSMTHCS